MKGFLAYLLVIAALLTGANEGVCANIKVTSPAVGTLSSGSTGVTFNLSWDASWRNATVIGNWDAAWVFVKFRTTTGGTIGDWKHASLNNTGHSVPAGATLTTGLVDTSSAFNIASNPAVGVFIYRSADGAGTFTANNVSLSWNYSQDGVTGSDTVEIRVFAIEMVYIPQAAFFAGDNATSTYSFKQGSSDNDPWYISSENAITTTNTAGTGTGAAETAAQYRYVSGSWTGESATGSVFTIPAAFPKGYQASYMMKGEISQGQWVAFFNTLTATQKSTRDITSATGKNSDSLTYRNNVSWSGSGDATLPDRGGGATYEWVAMTYLSWGDLTAYLDWAGLRPMSELEFEKAARGIQRAVSGEYAWGSTSITQATSISNAGLSNERAQSGANAAYGYGSDASVPGPLRVGSFAYGVATRIASGGGYYGVMELSGNVWERPVTVGNSTGRSLEGRYHGNGALDSSGNPNVTSWPGTGATGSGFRGGNWYVDTSYARISDRDYAAYVDTSRYYDGGGRGVRVAPEGSFRLSCSDVLLPVNSNLASTGDFTYEMWVKYDVNQTYWAATFLGDTASPNFSIHARVVTGMKWRFDLTGATTLDSTSAANNAAWTHVAYVRSGSSVKLYINGTEESSGTSDLSTIRVGTGDMGSPLAGYGFILGRGAPPYYPYGDNCIYANFSVVTAAKTSRYTANFTPSTKLTNDSHTLFYLVNPRSAAATVVVDRGPYNLSLGSHGVTTSAESP